MDPALTNKPSIMDPRSNFKKLYSLARFSPGNVVYYNGRMHEVVKRFYRISEQCVLYDFRDARTSDVRRDVPQDDLMAPAEHHARA